MGEPEGVPRVLNDDHQPLISDLIRSAMLTIFQRPPLKPLIANTTNTNKSMTSTTLCLNTTAILLRYISIFLHCQKILTNLTPHCPSCITTSVPLAFLKHIFYRILCWLCYLVSISISIRLFA